MRVFFSISGWINFREKNLEISYIHDMVLNCFDQNLHTIPHLHFLHNLYKARFYGGFRNKKLLRHFFIVETLRE